MCVVDNFVPTKGYDCAMPNALDIEKSAFTSLDIARRIIIVIETASTTRKMFMLL